MRSDLPPRYTALIAVLLVVGLIAASGARADETGVRIEAPAVAAAGDEITVTVHVTHEGNNFFHFTDWVWLKAGDREIGRWAFSAQERPEDERFSRQVTYTVSGPTVFTAQGNCNVHGSAGPARAELRLAGAGAAPAAVASASTARTSGGRNPLGWAVLLLGVANLLLCGFQVATGRRWIKVKIAVHRRSGQTLLAMALVHGLLAVLLNL